MKARSVSICFRGFDVPPSQVESIVGIPATLTGKKGDSVRPGVSAILKRSFVHYSVDFPGGSRLDEMVQTALDRLGGVQHLCEVRDRVQPEFLEIEIMLPVKHSEEQEGGLLSNAVLTEMVKLHASLSFGFV